MYAAGRPTTLTTKAIHMKLQKFLCSSDNYILLGYVNVITGNVARVGIKNKVYFFFGLFNFRMSDLIYIYIYLHFNYMFSEIVWREISSIQTFYITSKIFEIFQVSFELLNIYRYDLHNET